MRIDRAWTTLRQQAAALDAAERGRAAAALGVLADLRPARGRAAPVTSWAAGPLTGLGAPPASVAVPAEPPSAATVAYRGLSVRTAELLGRAAVDLSSAAAAPSRGCLTLAVRFLTELIGARHPGRSIELRVPPAAAVQCGRPDDGPTHTRGTPPNVAETDPATFLALATGALGWAEARATHRVSASGTRADLGWMFPLLAPPA